MLEKSNPFNPLDGVADASGASRYPRNKLEDALGGLDAGPMERTIDGLPPSRRIVCNLIAAVCLWCVHESFAQPAPQTNLHVVSTNDAPAYFVSSTGDAGNGGTQASPWPLSYALTKRNYSGHLSVDAGQNS
jgi:hypothetical protein